jgi:hypothetical protein
VPLTIDDRLAIQEALARYCFCLDQGRWDEFRALFTADARLDFGEVMGVWEGADGVRRFTETMAGLGLFMRHYVTNVLLSGDGTSAHAECYVLAVTGRGDQQMVATGRYDDRFVKQDGRWLLASRHAVIER